MTLSIPVPVAALLPWLCRSPARRAGWPGLRHRSRGPSIDWRESTRGPATGDPINVTKSYACSPGLDRARLRPCLDERRGPGAIGREERRMADLRRRSRQHALLAARSDQRGELQQARGRLALQDRQPRSAPGVQSRVDAADGQRHRSTRPPARGAPSSRSMPPPASCSGCTASSEGARGAAAPRQLSGRGLAYWTDGREERILYVTPGYRLIALDAKTGRAACRLRQRTASSI